MNTDFLTNLAHAAADDLIRFSTEFPLFIIGFMLVLLTVTVLFRNRREMSYGDLVKAESDKHLKQVAKQLKKEKLFEAVELDIGSLIGSEIYVYQDIDFLFDFLIEKGSENELEEDEKKLRKYIHKNEKGMAQVFKKNIAEIYLRIDDRKHAQVNIFELVWYAYNFPHMIDLNLDGNYIIDTRQIEMQDIVNIFENPENRFNFEEYFYFVIGLINSHELDMKTYMKIKEIFSEQIINYLNAIELKQKKEVKVNIDKDNEQKTKEIYKQFKKSNPQPKEPTKLEDVLPKVTDENDTPPRVENTNKNKDKKPTQNTQKNKEKNNPKSQPKKVVKKETEKEEISQEDLHKPYIDENGKYTSRNLENKKEALKDINNQKEIAKKLKEEKFAEQEEIPVPIQNEDEVIQENINIESLVSSLQKDIEDKKSENEEVVESKTEEENVEIDSLVASIQKDIEEEKTENKNESEIEEELSVDASQNTQFKTAKNIRKKDFNPIRDFPKILKTVQKDAVVLDTFLIFKLEDKVYINTEYLFLKIENQYLLKDHDNFSFKFVTYLSGALALFNNKKNIEHKSINIKIPKENKQCSTVFLIFSTDAIEKYFEPTFFKKMRKLKEIRKFDLEKTNMMEYLKTRMETQDEN